MTVPGIRLRNQDYRMENKRNSRLDTVIVEVSVITVEG